MQVLKLSLIILAFLSFVAESKTLKVDTVTPSVTDGDFTITPNGTGDIVLGSSTGFVRLTSGILSTQVTTSLTTDISGILPIANGGTNSSSSLSSGFVMESVGGAIVESSTTSAELSYLDATSSIQDQLDALETGVVEKTANATLATTLENKVFANPTSGSFTLTLPTAVGNQGLQYTISKLGITTNTVTIDGAGAENVGFESSKVLVSLLDTITIISNGSSWSIVSDEILGPMARYTSNRGHTFSSLTALNYEDKDYDTHSAYNSSTGVYTVPTGMGGKYRIKAIYRTQASTWSVGDFISIRIVRTGDNPRVITPVVSTTSASYMINIDETLSFDEGDTFSVSGFNSQDVSMNTSTVYNSISIERVK